jgi:hypothetical protein
MLSVRAQHRRTITPLTDGAAPVAILQRQKEILIERESHTNSPADALVFVAPAW